jgi:hypothetical protein
MTDVASAQLACLAWSRIFSPLVPPEWRADAWQLLELPGTWAEAETEFWSTFEVGLPGPRVSLLLHAALGRDGGRAREDWLRVASHLGLVWEEHTLPPDHLGIACELLACAVHAGEDVLVRELCTRYLRPWCEAARARLAADAGALGALPSRFEADLRSIEAEASAPGIRGPIERGATNAGVDLGRARP